MNNSIVLSLMRMQKEKIFFAMLVALVLTGGAFAFPLSYLTNSNELIGLCLIPFVVTIQGSRRFNFIFLLFFILFGCGSYVYGVRMFYFFALAFYILWLIELFFGRVNILTVFLLGFMSPFFYQVSAILGFPIRLQLSRLAGMMLQSMGVQIQVEGNIMLLDGSTFAVDEACMGLNMLAISMLMGVFILAHNYRITKLSLKMKHILLFFACGFGLNMIANLFRIMILVLFKIGPDNPTHEVIGLLCVCIYVLIPLYFLGSMLTHKLGYEPEISANAFSIAKAAKPALVMVALSLMLVGVNLDKRKLQTATPHALTAMPGYTVTKIGTDVTKMTNGDILIYIKPIQEFFNGEHTPLLCWKGSGYTFSCIGQSKIDDKEIYCGQLVKEKEKLFTAWWYTNGKIQTISQLDWRFRMMKGEKKFNLVNVTAGDERKLNQILKSIFKNDQLK